MVVAGGFLIGFLWAVKKGQYEDTYSPSVRILFDDEEIKDFEQLQKVFKSYPIGTEVQIGVVRDQQKRKVSLVLE